MSVGWKRVYECKQPRNNNNSCVESERVLIHIKNKNIALKSATIKKRLHPENTNDENINEGGPHRKCLNLRKISVTIFIVLFLLCCCVCLS